MEFCYQMARLSMGFSGKTVDNLVSESLCSPCNPLRSAEFEARPHLMDRPDAAVRGRAGNGQAGSG